MERASEVLKSERAASLWTRRGFVQGALSVAALAQLRSPLAGAQAPTRDGFAYVASGSGHDGVVQVFRVRGERWSGVHSVASRGPAFLLLSPSGKALYVANAVDKHDGLPRGTVEAYLVDPADGSLTLLGRQALSLSATRPQHLALSPDGKTLAVAAYEGGIYNLLPVAEDGSLGRPAGIRKEAGRGAHEQLQGSSHPHSILFDSAGNLLASDFGLERVSAFSLDEEQLTRRSDQHTGAASGPGSLALSPNGTRLFAWHGLEGSLASYPYDPATGTIGARSVQVPGETSPLQLHAAIAVHPSGRMLYSTKLETQTGESRLQAWQIEPGTGKLTSSTTVTLGRVAPRQTVAANSRPALLVAATGESILLSDRQAGSIWHVALEPKSGEPGRATRTATIPGCRSVAFRTI